MKLAIIRQKYNAFGGAERFIAGAIAALGPNAGLDLTVIARQWQSDPGVHFVECNPPYHTSLGRDKSFAEAVRAHLAGAAGHYDIVQSHERIPGIMLFRAGDGVHATWLEQRARATPAFRRFAIAANPHHRYLTTIEREMFAHPDLATVICNSHMVRDDIVKRFGVPPEKLTVIYNGVDLERFNPRNRAGREAVRATLGVPIDAPLFIYAGSGFERKGVARLLRALAAAPPTAQVLIAGEDKHLKRYRVLASELKLGTRAHFLGGRSDLADLYGAADAFVLPTLYDPLPNAALEALASGLPVLTTTQCGAREFIRTGSNGFVVDALDHAGMVDAMAELAAPGRALAMAAAARASVAHLSGPAMAAELVALYRRLRPGG